MGKKSKKNQTRKEKEKQKIAIAKRLAKQQLQNTQALPTAEQKSPTEQDVSPQEEAMRLRIAEVKKCLSDSRLGFKTFRKQAWDILLHEYGQNLEEDLIIAMVVSTKILNLKKIPQQEKREHYYYKAMEYIKNTQFYNLEVHQIVCFFDEYITNINIKESLYKPIEYRKGLSALCGTCSKALFESCNNDHSSKALERLNKAEICCQKVSTLLPPKHKLAIGAIKLNASICHEKGLIEYNNGNFKEAERILRDALKINPDYVQKDIREMMHINLILSLGKQKKIEDKVIACKKALKENVKDKDLYITYVSSLVILRKFEDIVKLCEDMTREGVDIQDEGFIHNHTFALAKLEKFEEAKICCQKGIETNPESTLLQFRLGCISAAEGKHKEAEECYRRSLKLPECTITIDNIREHTYVNLTKLLVTHGRCEDAVTVFEDALSKGINKSEFLYINYVAALRFSTEPKFQDIIDIYNTVGREINIKDGRFFDSCAFAFIKLGKFKEAKICCQKGIETNPESTLLQFRLGCISAAEGDNEKAKNYYRNVIAKNLESLEANLELGFILLKENNQKEAKKYLTKSLEMQKANFAKPNSLGEMELMLDEITKTTNLLYLCYRNISDYTNIIESYEELNIIKSKVKEARRIATGEEKTNSVPKTEEEMNLAESYVDILLNSDQIKLESYRSKAEQILREIIAQDKNNLFAHYYLGLMGDDQATRKAEQIALEQEEQDLQEDNSNLEQKELSDIDTTSFISDNQPTPTIIQATIQMTGQSESKKESNSSQKKALDNQISSSKSTIATPSTTTTSTLSSTTINPTTKKTNTGRNKEDTKKGDKRNTRIEEMIKNNRRKRIIGGYNLAYNKEALDKVFNAGNVNSKLQKRFITAFDYACSRGFAGRNRSGQAGARLFGNHVKITPQGIGTSRIYCRLINGNMLIASHYSERGGHYGNKRTNKYNEFLARKISTASTSPSGSDATSVATHYDQRYL